MQRKITKTTVDWALGEATRTGKAVIVVDTETKGFMMRAAPPSKRKAPRQKDQEPPKATATYFLQFWSGGRAKTGGKSERVRIGVHSETHVYPATGKKISWTHDTARTEAEYLRGLFLAGANPAAEKRQRKQAAKIKADIEKNGETFAAAWDTYSREVLHNPRKPKRSGKEQDRLIAKGVTPTLGKGPFQFVTNDQLRGVIKGLAVDSPANARTTRVALKGLYSWACDRDRGDRLSVNAMDGIAKPADSDNERDRWLGNTIHGEREIAALWTACEAIGWPFGPAVQLLLLTGQRRDEVCGMRWAEVNLNKGEWVVPKERMKTGKPHIIDLAPRAVRILKAVPHVEACGLVFSTTGHSQISGFSKIKRRIDALMAKELGIAAVEDWVLHDLRRTMVTNMADNGVPEHVADKILAHTSGKISGVKARYQQSEFRKERREALHQWAAIVTGIVAAERRRQRAESRAPMPMLMAAE